MNKHIFHLRMSATYESSENNIASLDVEVLDDNTWSTLDLNIKTPGFLIYTYSIFTCQHLYLRTNGIERELLFNNAQGKILVQASDDWHLERVDVKFEVRLASGDPNKDNIEYIISRMKQCPVSKNLPQGIDIDTHVEFRHG